MSYRSQYIKQNLVEWTHRGTTYRMELTEAILHAYVLPISFFLLVRSTDAHALSSPMLCLFFFAYDGDSNMFFRYFECDCNNSRLPSFRELRQIDAAKYEEQTRNLPNLLA